jgi:dTDP-4-dehydrorhamnose reductase
MKIILFGGSGMLGRYVNDILSNIYKIECVSRDMFDIANDDFNKLKKILNTNELHSNDIVINCSGLIPQKICKNNKNLYKDYIKINTIFPHNLNKLCLEYNLRFIHITTNCVYSGNIGNYNIRDKHDTEDIYGISKSLGEPLEATIIRTSIIGEEFYNKTSLLEWVISNKNKEINGFMNHYWNGVTCLTLAKIIKYIIDNNLYWKGVKHISSPNVVTKYELCNYINEIYDLNIKIIPFLSKHVNLTLQGEDIFKIDEIKQQIIEQKLYNINIGKYTTINNCRFCSNNNLYEIKKFRDFPLSGNFLKRLTDIPNEKIYPLTLMFCDKCKTGLIKEVISADTLFKNIHNNGYFYYSSTINTLVLHFKKLFQIIIEKFPKCKKILEIGCNDGVFLNNFSNFDKNYQIIGIDPSETIKKIKSENIIKYNTFFNDTSSRHILDNYGKQDIIVCCNCLAHINDINDIYKNIKMLLNDNGILIIEVHYIRNITNEKNFDFIYHEHMSYYSINTIIQVCKNNNLYLDDIEFIDTHGGSIRCFIKNTENTHNAYYNKNIEKYIETENNIYNEFLLMFDNLEIWRTNIIDMINGTKIKVGYGASGRTNMIINFLSVKFDIILDDSEHKINSYMPYYHTPIINSENIYENVDIEVIYILAWTYSKSIIFKHKKFIENGGIFIKILPTIEIINSNNYQKYLC